MRRTKLYRTIYGLALCLLAISATGCTHYHYYGQATPPAYLGQGGSICDPVATSEAPLIVAAPSTSSPVVASKGAICEVPGSQEYVINGQAMPQQQVLSSSPSSGSRNRFAWRRPDPESMATTRVDGSLSSTPVR